MLLWNNILFGSGGSSGDADTRNKRAAAIAVFFAPRLILPAPSGTINAEGRSILAFSYGGIAAASPGGGGGVKAWLYRNHTMTLGAGFGGRVPV